MCHDEVVGAVVLGCTQQVQRCVAMGANERNLGLSNSNPPTAAVHGEECPGVLQQHLSGACFGCRQRIKLIFFLRVV